MMKGELNGVHFIIHPSAFIFPFTPYSSTPPRCR
jgi:hypothetical protein